MHEGQNLYPDPRLTPPPNAPSHIRHRPGQRPQFPTTQSHTTVCCCCCCVFLVVVLLLNADATGAQPADRATHRPHARVATTSEKAVGRLQPDTPH